MSLNKLEKRVAKIEARNSRVETDKNWETSWIRRISTTVLVFAVTSTFLYTIDNSDPVVNAIVASGGYFLSTLVLKSIRKIWEKK